jgi:Zn-dependent peptidase ImmA (M78 family)
MTTIPFPQFGALCHSSYSRVRVVATANAIRSTCDQRRQIPFDPVACAERFGIRVRMTSLPKGIGGRLAQEGTGYRIDLQQSDPRTRQRFTLAHELCHVAFDQRRPSLPHERGVIYETTNIQRREELLCDRIAAELLMPTSAFRRCARQLNHCFASVCDLAQEFDVSVTAVLSRIQELRVWSIGTRRWTDGSRGKLLATVHRDDSPHPLSLKAEITSVLLHADSIAMSQFQHSAQLVFRYQSGAFVSMTHRSFELTIRRAGVDSYTAVVLT